MSLKKILIPIDKSEKTLNSLKVLKSLFQKEEVKIILLHVIDDFSPGAVDYVNMDFINDLSELSEAVLDRASSIISGYDFETVSLIGNPVKEIFNVAEKENVDLVIMTKTGSGIIDKYILGSVTSKVLKKTDVPVMIIP